MMPQFVVGTSGYSFADWVGPFYPEGTRQNQMFAHYVGHFQCVELNFTFYGIPAPATLERMSAASPAGFEFWVKANQDITHNGKLQVAAQFMDAVAPLQVERKLAGIVLQFPQSFHRTVESRKYLLDVVERMRSAPLAVEFRHRSWDTPQTADSLRERGLTLVVPDSPPIDGLYRPQPTVTSRIGYLRLHSRNPRGWYQGMAERYDYDYSEEQLREIADEWSQFADADKVYTMFNNCHRGQAARNAEQLRKILDQV